MNEVNLRQNEVIILESEDSYFGNDWHKDTLEKLVLTNFRLICFCGIHRFFRKSEYYKDEYSLNDILTYNNAPMVSIDDSEYGCGGLVIQFKDGKKIFEFGSDNDAKKWVNVIREVIAGTYNPAANHEVNSLSEGISKVFGFFKKTINATKKEMGEDEVKESATIKCDGCGSHVSGFKGQTVKCPYCGNTQTLN